MITDKSISLKHSKLKEDVVISLPASKSISNRALIINALCPSPSPLENLSEARDTQTMIKLLNSESSIWDVKDAGTTMRFLTAYASVTNKQKTMTGTPRMKQRPIGILIDALKELGADIRYDEKEGFPPHSIHSFSQKTNKITIAGNVSSQYISALLMIAPTLENGLTLNIAGDIGSRPYIEMTLSIMDQFGVRHKWDGNKIVIKPQKYTSTSFSVEPDWSAASYWYSFVTLSNNSSVLLKGLTENSLQGDSVLSKFMLDLGVKTIFTVEGALLTKFDHKSSFKYDFTHCPDLAQTVAVICAAKGIKGEFTGLESLKIKETDRVKALTVELGKINSIMKEQNGEWIVEPSTSIPSTVSFDTYEDHRMAMAFAPLSLLMNLSFDDQSVVEKSYPRYWDDINKSMKK